MAWLWRVMRPWAIPILKARLRIRVEGNEHVPRRGAAIIASNHLSALDHVVLPAVTKRVIYNISKKEHFDKPVKAWFMRHWGVIPIDRGRGDTAALDQAKQIIRSGELFCIYPEGTRSPDGRLYKGRTGVARLALETGAPVVPVAMVGTFEAKPKGQRGINRGVRTAAVVGRPLHFDAYHGMQGDREVCRKVTDEVMAAIHKLSGQEYVYDYAPNPAYDERRKRGIGRASSDQVDDDAIDEAYAALRAQSSPGDRGSDGGDVPTDAVPGADDAAAAASRGARGGRGATHRGTKRS